MSRVLLVSSAVIACFLSFVLHVALNSPISPRPLPLPTSYLTPNNLLQKVEKLGEGRLVGPEDVVASQDGTLYTATRDGWIRRMHPNRSWEDWVMVGGEAVLGMTEAKDGTLIVCDVDKGLLKVGDEGVTILASVADDGSPIRFADDAIEASDGTVYFSDASDKFGLHDWFLDVLEAKPHGRLLKYDPSTKKTSVVISGLGFANGVALSADQDYLVVCETWRFRCLKYWLKGEMEGKSEVFVDSLPGGPDNINLAPDGSFWIALLELRSGGLNLIHGSALAKRAMAAFPELLEFIRPVKRRAMAVNVAADGTIRRALDDSDGSVMSFVTSALEFDGHLYLGSLGTDFIGKISLQKR